MRGFHQCTAGSPLCRKGRVDLKTKKANVLAYERRRPSIVVHTPWQFCRWSSYLKMNICFLFLIRYENIYRAYIYLKFDRVNIRPNLSKLFGKDARTRPTGGRCVPAKRSVAGALASFPDNFERFSRIIFQISVTKFKKAIGVPRFMFPPATVQNPSKWLFSAASAFFELGIHS